MLSEPQEIRVAVKLSYEVIDYFKDYNLSRLADLLLEQYDVTSLPSIHLDQMVQRNLTITNPYYIQLKQALPSTSPRISLSRLFEYAYTQDILANPAPYASASRLAQKSYIEYLQKARGYIRTAYNMAPGAMQSLLQELLSTINEVIKDENIY